MPEQPEYYHNIESDVGLKEPKRKTPFSSYKSFYTVWDGEKYVLLRVSYGESSTRRNAIETERFYYQSKIPDNPKVVEIVDFKPEEKKEK